MQKTITVEATIRYEGKWCGDGIDSCEHSIQIMEKLICGLFPDEIILIDMSYPVPLRCQQCLKKTGDV